MIKYIKSTTGGTRQSRQCEAAAVAGTKPSERSFSAIYARPNLRDIFFEIKPFMEKNF